MVIYYLFFNVTQHTYAKNPNINTLAMSNLPRGRDRKGGGAKHQRTRNCNPPLIDNVTVRSGMQTSVNSDARFGTLVNVSYDNVTVGSGSVSNNIHVFLDGDVPSPSFSPGPPPLISIPCPGSCNCKRQTTVRSMKRYSKMN